MLRSNGEFIQSEHRQQEESLFSQGQIDNSLVRFSRIKDYKTGGANKEKKRESWLRGLSSIFQRIGFKNFQDGIRTLDGREWDEFAFSINFRNKSICGAMPLQEH